MKRSTIKYFAFYTNNLIDNLYEVESGPTPNNGEDSSMGSSDDVYTLRPVTGIPASPIINDIKDKNGNRVAYTMGSPRYVTLESFKKAQTTSQLILI